MHATADTLMLVTGSDCELCEHGRAVVARLGIDACELAVESEEAVRLAAAGIALAFLPVLTDGERVIAYGRFSEKRLRKGLGL